ncbi:MAG: MoaD/ThiS family protein [Chloroflexi bacterium]|nr:MoaD/ThiS family protein [Chloroflexota bacterium]
MPATLRPSGALRELVGGLAEVQVEAGRTVRETLAALGIVPEVVALVVVNEEQRSKDYVIQEGDVIRVLAVIGGG